MATFARGFFLSDRQFCSSIGNGAEVSTVTLRPPLTSRQCFLMYTGDGRGRTSSSQGLTPAVKGWTELVHTCSRWVDRLSACLLLLIASKPWHAA